MNQTYEQAMDIIYVVGFAAIGVGAVVSMVWGKLRKGDKP